MRKCIWLTVFVALSFLCASAQSTENTDCPSLTISGPAGIVKPGDTGRYSAQVSNIDQKIRLEYKWSANTGEVVSGRGTPTISLKFPNSSSVTVTVEVKGFPEGCPNTASESAVWDDLNTKPIQLDEFSPINSPKFDAAKVFEIALNAKNNPNSQLYILMYFAPGTTTVSQTKQTTRLRSKLTKNGQMDPGQITIVVAYSDPSRLKFYLVSPGAANPQP